MKKIFTLFAGILFAAAVMAADRGPSVIISSSKNYKILIDGRSYFGSSATIRIANLSAGIHSIKIYEMKNSFFSKGEKLVSSSTFKVRKRDVAINVDQFGRIVVQKNKSHYQFNSKRNKASKKNGPVAQRKKVAINGPTYRF